MAICIPNALEKTLVNDILYGVSNVQLLPRFLKGTHTKKYQVEKLKAFMETHLSQSVDFGDAHIEELLPQRKEILRSGKGRQVPCRDLTNSSLDPPLKGRDCAELPVQILFDQAISTMIQQRIREMIACQKLMKSTVQLLNDLMDPKPETFQESAKQIAKAGFDAIHRGLARWGIVSRVDPKDGQTVVIDLPDSDLCEVETPESFERRSSEIFTRWLKHPLEVLQLDEHGNAAYARNELLLEAKSVED